MNIGRGKYYASAVLVVLLASGTLLALRQAACVPTIEEAPARVLDVGALGILEPASRVIALAASNPSSVIARWFVNEGSQVSAGQILAITDEHALRQAELKLSAHQLATAQAQLAKILEGAYPEELRAAQSVLDQTKEREAQARRELHRLEKLHLQGTISTQEIEQQRSAVSQISANATEAASRLRALRQSREAELRIRSCEVDAASGAVGVAEEALRRTQITSPIAARILRIHARAGEVTGQRSIADLGDTERMFATAEVHEGDVPRVQVGQRASVKLRSSGLKLHGRVTQIVPIVGRKIVLDNDPVTDTDARVVSVRIELAQEDSPKVAQLSNARVEIIIHSS